MTAQDRQAERILGRLQGRHVRLLAAVREAAMGIEPTASTAEVAQAMVQDGQPSDLRPVATLLVSLHHKGLVRRRMTKAKPGKPSQILWGPTALGLRVLDSHNG